MHAYPEPYNSLPLKAEASLSSRGLEISNALLRRAGEVGVGLPCVVALGVALPLDQVVRYVAAANSSIFLRQDLFHLVLFSPVLVELG